MDILLRKTPTQLRSELLDIVSRDLLGPAGGPEEELDSKSAPRRRYLVGFLAPSHQRVRPHESDSSDRDPDESEDGQAEPTALQATTLRPSSMGLSFSVAKDVEEIALQAEWGRYEKVESAVLTDPESGGFLRVWQRTQHNVPKTIPLIAGSSKSYPLSEFEPEITIRVQVRVVDQSKVVSLFIVNGQVEPQRNQDESWLFQVGLAVAACDGKPIFQERQLLRKRGNLSQKYWDEVRTQSMRYRRHGEYAMGHGVAVTVERDGPLASRLKTRALPRYEVEAQKQPSESEAPKLAGLTLDMELLAKIPDGGFTRALAPLIDAYESWVVNQEQCIQDKQLEEYRDQAESALLGCLRAQDRLREGLKVLDANPQAAQAFRFANLAMSRQRIRSIFAQDTRRGIKQELDQLERPENRSWRLFQLAFFLLNVPAMVDPLHPTRSDPQQHLVDLLWFPTGGGKTEAYLGVAAFTMGLRRLQGRVGAYDGLFGVAVLMRYTLRLLTLQQFQRAAALICACEDIRREAKEHGRNPWGDEPFRIGLWVGQKTTPNRTDDADEAVRESRGGGFTAGRSGKPLQLTSCPWCGTKIDEGKHVEVETFAKGRGRTIVYCGDSMGDCLFSQRRSKGEGLPIITVDEEIYRRLPTLLISTVDKFAQMPWRGETATLFGRVTGYCPRHGFRSPDLQDSDSHPAKNGYPSVRTQHAGPLRPPDLIIQDELHLISGPLGTLVGLYESAVDELCTWDYGGAKVRPKVIASTATVRQAAEQIEGVFARKVEIFPAPGLDAADNFFARNRSTDEMAGRFYLGVCAPGASIKGALIRVYSAFLSGAQVLYERYGQAADPWMTLAGYFGSIRELGSMRRSCDDSVRSWVRKYAERGLANRNVSGVTELTSRVASSEIPKILDDLEVKFDPEAEIERKAAWKANRKSEHRKPIDILLATNMISVGVDVNRLGLMVVAGQPKNTAEYIQATSRVGRSQSAPGIVCTVYNWARPRDLSHYEKFEHFHATFYQHVEALSVTPFAARALDRGLTSVLCAAARLFEERYNANDSAQAFQREDKDLLAVLERMRARVAVVSGDQAAKAFSDQIDQRLHRWHNKIAALTDGTRLGYKGRKDGLTVGLLSEATGAWDDWTVLNSLRNVEATVGLILTGDGIGGSDE